MGQLIPYSKIDNADASVFFRDASYYDGKYYFKWPNDGYPHILTIFMFREFKYGDVFVDIREWIEDTLSETVIYDYVDKSYRVVKKDINSWERYDRAWKVNNRYIRFHFRKSESALLFKIRFGNLIKDISNKSPEDDFDYNEYEIYY